MALINPYNFVPINGKPDRSEYPGRDRLRPDSYSGILKCFLNVINPLISIDHQDYGTHRLKDKNGSPLNNKFGRRRGQPYSPIKVFKFIRHSQNKKPYIPGSSIKGMIRSVYECITDSCLPLAAQKGDSNKAGRNIPYSYDVPIEYQKSECSQLTRLCPACLLFGTIMGEELHCQGRLNFSDAELEQGKLHRELCFLKELSNPKPHHNATYVKGGTRTGQIAGRKFYYHADKSSSLFIREHDSNDRSVAIKEYADKSCKFVFNIFFENITSEELENLIFSIQLRKGLGHKIGLGKAIGMGSCCIKIDPEKSRISKSADRYKKWNNESNSTILQNILEYIQDIKRPPELKEVLRLDKYKDGTIGYPTYQEYNKEYKNARIDDKGFFQTVNKKGGQNYGQSRKTSGSSRPSPEFNKHKKISPVINSVDGILKEKNLMKNKVLVELIRAEKKHWLCKRHFINKDGNVSKEDDYKIKRKNFYGNHSPGDLFLGTQNNDNPKSVENPKKVGTIKK